jgi:hypothetical protein
MARPIESNSCRALQGLKEDRISIFVSIRVVTYHETL